MLSIVLPTISGREASFERTRRAYRRTLKGVPNEIIVVRDEKNWPTACNLGYERASGDVLHFGADDLVPLAGWHVDALDLLSVADELPAAFVWNYDTRGEPDNAVDGQPGDLTHFTRVPIMRRDQYERIGPWPDIDYASDVWLSERARYLGIPTRLVGSYRFVHHWHQHGRLDTPGRLKRSYDTLDALRSQGGLA